MHKLGIINLGLTPDNFERFQQRVLDVRGNDWGEELYTSHYNKIDPTEIAASCDALVLSPGDAPVGLLNYDRARREPQIGPLYSLIEAAIIEGDVPVLGVNAGYMALVDSLGCGIKAIPNDDKGNHHKKRVHDLSQVDDPITEGIGEITIALSNNYGVLPNQKMRWGQGAITHIDSLGKFALMSVVKTTSGAPVYGVQFNIGDGTEPIFRNFFKLAHQYLQRKQA